ncbi:MAG: nucleotidyltransferase family protein [Candidatus Helarchaeota archaeon]|nr:nucleotidyltransferase family protein [Candidatus Helarchaeota archaeon]
MSTKESIIDKLRGELPYLKQKFKIKKIGLFGSYIRGEQRDESDVDIFMEFEKPIGLEFMDLIDYLENLLEKKVDILTPEGINSIRIEQIARNIERSIVYV